MLSVLTTRAVLRSSFPVLFSDLCRFHLLFRYLTLFLIFRTLFSVGSLIMHESASGQPHTMGARDSSPVRLINVGVIGIMQQFDEKQGE